MEKNLLFKKGMNMLSIAVCSIALLSATQQSNAQEVISSNRTGTQDGWYWSFWKDNGNASMTLYPGGRYTTTWNGVNNFTAGKGWAVGKADRSICFEGSFNGGSNGFLAVYGWTKNALIEYYVVENYGQWTPPGGTSKGTFTSDGGTYNIYETTRTNQPSIIGTATFQQYWSVRTSKRSSGTVTFANHVAAWKAKGMNMGSTWDYQIIESEGCQSTGNSDVTIKDCNSCATAAPTVTASVTYEQGATASQLTASGTSLKWYTSESGGTASSTAPTPNTSTTGTTVYYVSSTANNCESARSSITVNVVSTYKIYKVSAPLVIDGNIEEVWNDGNVKPMNATKLLSGTVSNNSDLSGYAKLLWDNTYLYFLAVVTDDTKQNDSQNSYDDDQVELYIDADNAKATAYDANDCQYSFGWDDGTVVGTIPSGASTSNITYSAVATANGYVIEARLPWSTVKANNPAGDKLLGIDFMINDDDNNGTRDAKLSWNSATDGAYADASLFGTGKLNNQQLLVTGLEGFDVATFSIFPNPATSELFVTGFTSEFEYEVVDYAGRAVLQGRSAEKIDIAKLDAGIYILKVKQGQLAKTVKISKL